MPPYSKMVAKGTLLEHLRLSERGSLAALLLVMRPRPQKGG